MLCFSRREPFRIFQAVKTSFDVFGHIDSPVEDELVYQHGFELNGWIRTVNGTPWKSVVVRLDDTIIGTTENRFARPDVEQAMGPEFVGVGFSVHCAIPELIRSAKEARLRCEVVDGEGAMVSFRERRVRFSVIDYRARPHGNVLTDAATAVLNRDDVYGSGPPSAAADHTCSDLIMRYVRTGESVIDVGCGIGAYYHALLPRGVVWTGCETRLDFVERMKREGLPVLHVDGSLPFADGAFDAAICIEVLEHVAAYEPFLAELSRVTRRVAVLSVPNFGAIPVTSARYAVPWHMLESDHKNFFTATSLKALLQRYFAHVETFEYGPLPELRSLDGISIKNHVFAVARHAEAASGRNG
jgi:SAM-dependent methyltransferase